MQPVYVIYLFMVLATSIVSLENAMFFKSLTTERDKHQLEYAVNSASDAAVQQMLDTAQITATGNTFLDPDFVWKVYKYTFLRSNNLYSPANMNEVETSFPSVVITVNDGYYMRLLVDEETTNGTEKGYRFTQKLPFARTVQQPSTTTGDLNTSIPVGTVVADTMDGRNIIVYGGENKYDIKQHDGNALPNEVGTAHDVVDINKMILQAIDYTMFYNSSRLSSQEDQSLLVVPDEVSEQLLSPSVNFIGPSIFAFSDNFSLKGKSYFNYYSVGGSQIVEAARYYTYSRDGKKYYSRLNPENFQGSSFATVDNIYSNARQAAEAGYYPDPLYY